jgi:thiol peroxidase
MAVKVTFGGNPVTLVGNPISVGDKAPDFKALNQDLSPFSLYEETEGKVVVLSAAPSLDTGICSLQAQRFNEEAEALGDRVQIVQISMDLPFAQKRFCAAEGVDSIRVVSDHKDAAFGEKYGFLMEEFRLLARGIVVIDTDRKVTYVEYVPEVKTHPDYDAALEAVKELVK